MKKDTISKKQNISLIEEIPKSSTVFRKLSQVNIILHGKSIEYWYPTHKFQNELQSVLAESIETDIFKHLKEVTYQTP